MRMDPAVAAVRAAVRRSLTDLPGGALVLAAVSGGADSLALAAALAAEAPRAGQYAGAVTIDHGLQDGSADRAAEVAKICVELGMAPVVIETVVVGTDGGPEAAAREARYDGLSDVARQTSAQAIAVGHTLDDQAESVLLGLARGSGARSLAGMPPGRRLDGGGQLIRPLLDLRRSTTRRACQVLGLTPWEDPHNSDSAFARSRVREQAMPVLEETLGPGMAEALARTAALLRADADALDGWAETVSDPGDVRVLGGLPAAVRTRVLRRAAIQAGAPAGALSAGHIAAIDALITAWHGQGPVNLPGGLVAHRAYDRLCFR